MSAIVLVKADFIITCDLQPTSLKAFHYRQAAGSSTRDWKVNSRQTNDMKKITAIEYQAICPAIQYSA